MQLAINIGTDQLIEALRILPIDEKIFIANKLEEQLLLEWDNYENHPDTLNRVNESMTNYLNNDTISLDDL
jgi:hypothetical protein